MSEGPKARPSDLRVSDTRTVGPILLAVAQTLHARVPRAVRAAEELAASLQAVTDDPAAAVVADRRHLLDRTLERIECVCRAGRRQRERLVVVVAAHLTS